MIRNYFKIAWRNLARNKGFTITNLLGLTIGMVCTIFIFLWITDELTYDKFNENYGTTYKIIANRDFKDNMFTDENMVFPLGKQLESGNPQIKKVTTTSHQQTALLNYNDVKIRKRFLQVTGDFFDIFTCKFVKGDKIKALAAPNLLTITESTAKAMFGNADPIDKTIKINNRDVGKVVAVIADLPTNTSVVFDIVAPYNMNEPQVQRSMKEWVNSSWSTYIQTTPNVNTEQLGKYITGIMFGHNKDKISTYFVHPMSKWHLMSEFKNGKNVGGMIEYVRLFGIIAIIILLIACINFMNLSTARSEKRAKEVGIRKTLGSQKMQLIMQFFSESILLTLSAFILAIAAVYLLLPSFNLMVDKQLHLHLADPVFITGSLVIIIFTGIVAGSYPAIYLSSFNPVRVLKGSLSVGKSAALPRRILVVGQFVISILLISATIIIYKQIQSVKGRTVGYNPNNLIMVPSTPSTDKNFAVIKQQLLASGNIKAVTRTSSPITDIWWRSGAPDWDAKPADTHIIFSGLATDTDLGKTMGIKFIGGHDFTGMPIDSSSIIFNKAAVDAMHLKDPVGKQVKYGKTFTVIGVTDNIVMASPFTPVEPMMIFYDKNGSSYITVRLNDNVQPKAAIAQLNKLYSQYSPADIFEYQFVDQEFGKKFVTEELISNITNLFAGLAIFICCIGLAGLASFTIERRFREIGIRKVLGATIRQVLMLIVQEFLKLVAVAFVIAVPITWWLMYNWLQKYTYHIDISIWMFVAVGLVILVLTIAVVGINTLKAALTNPVKSLRAE